MAEAPRDAADDASAQLAIEMYAYSVRKQIAAVTAALEGADLLAFTGGIGRATPGTAQAFVVAFAGWACVRSYREWKTGRRVRGKRMWTLALTAAAPAAACDPAAYQGSIDNLEDRAFQALKAANEAVAKAARSGEIGSAGDAEWAAYKRLRADAEAQRLLSLKALSACRAAIPVASQPAEPGPVPSAKVAQPASSRRFALSVAGSGSQISISADHLRATSQMGAYAEGFITIRTPLGPPPPAPAGPPPGAFPNGNAGPPGPAVVTRGPQLSSRAWSAEQDVAVNFAPGGQNQAGWRFGARAGLETLRIKQFLAAPLASTFVLGPTTGTPVISPTGNCSDEVQPGGCSYTYVYSAPYTQTGFSFDGIGNAGLASVNVTQKQTAFRSNVSAAYEVVTPSPLGRLKLTAGVAAGSAWYDLRETTTVVTQASLANPATTFHGRRTASGPGFRAALTFDISGRLVPSWPLFWSVSAAGGAERVSFNVQDLDNSTTLFRETKAVYEYGGGLTYRFNPRFDTTFAVTRKHDFYTSFLSSAANGIQLPSGASVDLRGTDATRFALDLDYLF